MRLDQVGTVESLWRYPVKSMRGEELESAYAGFLGIDGDRLFAIHDKAAPADFPYLTGRQREEMLLFRPRFRDRTSSATASRQTMDVETPEGTLLALDDPALLDRLAGGLDPRHQLSLLRSERPMTDAHPVSLFSLQTACQLGEELGIPIDKRRFRANIYLDLKTASGFQEDEFVGRSLGIGATVVLSVLERDPRCKMITLDPDTSQANPEVMKRVARAHQRCAGVYAGVLVEGSIRPGDEVCLLP